jgi:predicted Rossmann fold nucleotide-binding protein DprA/Smf involved in DNA uptake
MNTYNKYDSSLIADLACSLTPGIGPIKYKKIRALVKIWPDDLWSIEIEQLIPLIGKNESFLLRENLDRDKVAQIIDKVSTSGIKILNYSSDKYPHRLKNIYDPPVCLFIKSKSTIDEISALFGSRLCIGIVGSRKYTSYGEIATKIIVSDLQNDKLVIISGLAQGIDSIAHTEAVKKHKNYSGSWMRCRFGFSRRK